MDDLEQQTLEARSTRTEAKSSAPTGEYINRVAELVASGEFRFPVHLSAEQSDWLAVRVLGLRRQRFLHFIARALAQSIYDDVQSTDRKVIADVEEQI